MSLSKARKIDEHLARQVDWAHRKVGPQGLSPFEREEAAAEAARARPGLEEDRLIEEKMRAANSPKAQAIRKAHFEDIAAARKKIAEAGDISNAA